MPTVILQFSEGGSQKFWAISSSGKSHTVVYGRIGSTGRQVTKNFGSAKEAQRSYDRLIESKLSNGYTYASHKQIRVIQAKSLTKRRSDAMHNSPAAQNRKTVSPKPRTKNADGALDDSIRTSWKRIVAWLTTNAPDLKSSLTAGAPAPKIRELEKRLCRKFPKDFNESLRIYTQSGGIIPDPYRSGLGYNHAFGLIPLSEIFNRWRTLTDLYDSGEFDDRAEVVKPGRGVVRQSWSASWIPFATNGGGDYYCIDLGPTWPGVRGQVIFVPHESEIRPLIATSFSSLLAALASAYECGDYEMSDRHGPIRKKRTTFPDAKD